MYIHVYERTKILINALLARTRNLTETTDAVPMAQEAGGNHGEL
jgi:hypothetical protein